jgi:hypothetical protein
MPKHSHLTLVSVLIAEFPRWLEYFEQHYPFTKSGQLALHRKTMELRKAHVSVSDAISDAVFVGSLYETLRAWGIGSRRSNLRSLPDFATALQMALPAIAALEVPRIDAEGLNVDHTVDAVWNAIETLNVVDNNAQLVAGTKTLHHLLPELVPPMDREYTQRCFSAHVPGLSPPAFSRLAFSRSGSTAPSNSLHVGTRGALLCAISRFSRLARLRLSVARGVYRL